MIATRFLTFPALLLLPEIKMWLELFAGNYRLVEKIYEILPEIEHEISSGLALQLETDLQENIEELEASDKAMTLGAKKVGGLETEIWESFTDGAMEEVALEKETTTLVDFMVNEVMDSYHIAKNEIVECVYSEMNESFVDENIGLSEEDRILYNSRYTSSIIIEATKDEIIEYAKLDSVEEISFYEEIIPEVSLAISLDQTKVYSDGGTGFDTSSYGGLPGYSGANIKVGIIEAEMGRYDSSALQLKYVRNLSFVENYRAGGVKVPSTVSPHATMVTSIIKGEGVTSGSRVYQGVVPGATVYQMAVDGVLDVYTAFQILVDKGVQIINFSAGVRDSTTYSAVDREIDRLIASTGVIFVGSAGNTGGNIQSPGHGLNVITVGNANTKLSATTARSAPYPMATASSYEEPSGLPNKPDIAAPGTDIVYVPNSSNEIQTGSGTSYAAPIVTGIIAQILQAGSHNLRGNPTLVKSMLLVGADPSKISGSGNPIVGNTSSNPFYEKSGAGLVNAYNSVCSSLSPRNFSCSPSISVTSSRYYFTAGQKVRAVMTFGKKNNLIPTSASNTRDDIDMSLRESGGAIVSSSSSSCNNVEILEYKISKSGYYYFSVDPARIVEAVPTASVAFTVS